MQHFLTVPNVNHCVVFSQCELLSWMFYENPHSKCNQCSCCVGLCCFSSLAISKVCVDVWENVHMIVSVFLFLFLFNSRKWVCRVCWKFWISFEDIFTFLAVTFTGSSGCSLLCFLSQRGFCVQRKSCKHQASTLFFLTLPWICYCYCFFYG